MTYHGVINADRQTDRRTGNQRTRVVAPAYIGIFEIKGTSERVCGSGKEKRLRIFYLLPFSPPRPSPIYIYTHVCTYVYVCDKSHLDTGSRK